MTYREALTVPLVFGDRRSIRAADTIQAVNEALAFAHEHADDIETARKQAPCPECSGDGTIECNRGRDHTCESCDGTGHDTSDINLTVNVNAATVKTWTAERAEAWLADMRKRFE